MKSIESNWENTIVCITSTWLHRQSTKVKLDLWPHKPKSITKGYLAKPGYWLGVCHGLFYLYWHSWAVRHAKQSRTSKFRELWSPARQQIWPWSRSKVTVKVTTWYHRKGLVTKNTHAKYQSSICNSAKVMAKVKVFVTDRRTDRQRDKWDLMSPRFRESGGQL